ncbi:uncharacterized protein [Amphiura filiformis]|uniref:uncharacterized protein isoform X4 n=1 Tax=Amphiura filiformis TaxID=82378 RepID=UPI003B21AE0C
MSRGGDSAQLFIGRLSKATRQRDLEDAFGDYGRMLRCDLKFGSGMAYAFIDYEDHRDAEDAIKYENGREIAGQSIVVEWARGPKRGYAEDECYKCGRFGHFARDCRDTYGRGGRGGGGGYGGGYGRRGGGGYDRYRRRSRSRDRRRSRSRSRSRSRRSRTRSRSRDRRSRSRSRDHDRKRSTRSGSKDRKRA